VGVTHIQHIQIPKSDICHYFKKYRGRVDKKYRLTVVVDTNRDYNILRFHLQLNHAVAA